MGPRLTSYRRTLQRGSSAIGGIPLKLRVPQFGDSGTDVPATARRLLWARITPKQVFLPFTEGSAFEGYGCNVNLNAVVRSVACFLHGSDQPIRILSKQCRRLHGWRTRTAADNESAESPRIRREREALQFGLRPTSGGANLKGANPQ